MNERIGEEDGRCDGYRNSDQILPETSNEERVSQFPLEVLDGFNQAHVRFEHLVANHCGNNNEIEPKRLVLGKAVGASYSVVKSPKFKEPQNQLDQLTIERVGQRSTGQPGRKDQRRLPTLVVKGGCPYG